MVKLFLGRKLVRCPEEYWFNFLYALIDTGKSCYLGDFWILSLMRGIPLLDTR